MVEERESFFVETDESEEEEGDGEGGKRGDLLMGRSARRKSARQASSWTLRQSVRRKWISLRASGLWGWRPHNWISFCGGSRGREMKDRY